MRFVRAFGGWGVAPGQFKYPWGIAVVRGLLVVAEDSGHRVQVLSLKGVPLQVVPLGGVLIGVCSDERQVWVADRVLNQLHVLKLQNA